MPSGGYDADGCHGLAVGSPGLVKRAVTRAFGFVASALLCGALLSWSVARIQGRMQHAFRGRSASSAWSLWHITGRSRSDAPASQWGGWFWETRGGHGSGTRSIRREALSVASRSAVPIEMPPYWSGARDDVMIRPGTEGSLVEYYEAGFGWPCVCLVSEDIRSVRVDDAGSRLLEDSVEVLHGVEWQRTQGDFITNWGWASWPWITLTSSPPLAKPISRTEVVDGVSHSVISSNSQFLPSRIVWSGMFANSSVYGLGLLATYRLVHAGLCGARAGFRYVLRNSSSARARRGSCRACGHPLAGLACCPECGAVVK